MAFYIGTCRFILYRFALAGYLIIVSLSGASSVVSHEVEIDAAMVRLGSAHEKFQNVGGLFKVEAEFSGFEPRLTCVGNVCLVEKKKCVGIMNMPYDESQRYRAGFKLNDGRFFYSDIIAAETDETHIPPQSSQAAAITNVMRFTLEAEVDHLTGVDFVVENPEEQNSDMLLTCVGFGMESCPSFMFDGVRRSFPAQLVYGENGNVGFNYLPLALGIAGDESAVRQTLAYSNILNRRQFSGFLFNDNGYLRGWCCHHTQANNQTLLSGMMSLFGVSCPRSASSVVHVQLMTVIEEQNVEGGSI